MTHIIFREFVGERIALPLWIDEGIASSQEKSNLGLRMKIVFKMVENNTYLSLDKLSEIRVESVTIPDEFYAQSASLIVFLIERFGRERFFEFCRQLRDGVQWQQALFRVYRFGSFKEMEGLWREFILRR